MSSATSSYAQIAGRVKFLLATADVSGCVVDGLSSVVTTDLSPSINIDGPVLLKDLGRQIVVADATTGAHQKTYRQVLIMDAAQAEGVGSEPPVYVLVSSASGTGVKVVRTG
jgi:hypothetical protein